MYLYSVVAEHLDIWFIVQSIEGKTPSMIEAGSANSLRKPDKTYNLFRNSVLNVWLYGVAGKLDILTKHLN